MKQYLPFYKASADYVNRTPEFRSLHLEHAWNAQRRGEPILAGVLATPLDGAILVFMGYSPREPDAFAEHDPSATEGLMASWRVREWCTS